MNPKRLANGGDPYYNPDYQYVPAGVQDMIFGLFNPYASEVMLQYGYQPPLGTPSITNPGTYIDPGPMPGPSGPPGVFTPPGPVTPLPGIDTGGPDTGGPDTGGPDPEPPPTAPPPPPPPPPSGPPTGYVSAAR